jgi:hypothetical protein
MANVGQTILGIDPCLQCMSLEQLEQLKLALYAKANNKTLPDNLASILEDSACYGCMSDHQREQIEITKLKQVFGGGKTIAELVEETKCLKCLDPKLVRSAALLMLSQYIDTQIAQT